MSMGFMVNSAFRTVGREVINFGQDLGRLVSRDADLKTRFLVISEIAGLAMAVYGAVLVGFGIAACATGVGIPAGLLLMGKGGVFFMLGWDQYKQSSNRIKYDISFQRPNVQLFEGTFAGIVLNVYLRCRGLPQLA